MSISTALFPPANREAATVAFLRTAWQIIRANTALGVAGGVIVTATQLARIDWPTVIYGVSAILLAGILAGALAAGDILVHGLPSSYTGVIASAPASAVINAPAAAPAVPAVTVDAIPPVTATWPVDAAAPVTATVIPGLGAALGGIINPTPADIPAPTDAPVAVGQ